MKQFLLVTLLLACTSLAAQKKNIGVVNTDSILHLIPGYTEVAEQTGKFRQAYETDLAQMESYQAKKARETDSMAPKDTPLIHQLRLLQLQQMKENLQAFQYDGSLRLQRDSLQMALFTNRYRTIETAVAAGNKCDRVIDSRTLAANRSDSVNYVNLNLAVAEKIKADALLMSNPKKIGYVSKDSLLSLLPGYQENKMICDLERQHLHDTVRQLEIEIKRMQQEINDSGYKMNPEQMQEKETAVKKKEEDTKQYVATETRNIATRDSARNAENFRRYNNAVEKVAASKELFVVQDYREAVEMWREQPAVLTNVNADVAKALGL